MYGIMILAAAVAESAVSTDVVSEGWWVPILGTILTVISLAVTYGLKKFASYIVNRLKASDAEKEAIQCLLQGMAKAQDEVVRSAKLAAADGKLTKKEVEQAKAVAIANALEVAKGPAKDVLIKMGSERLGSLIKQLLAKFAKGKTKNNVDVGGINLGKPSDVGSAKPAV